MSTSSEIKRRFELLEPYLNEQTKRLYLAAEAKSCGWGGISTVYRATGVSRNTITIGCKELENGAQKSKNRIRKPGGGRKKIVDKDPTLVSDLERLIDPVTRGDPMSPLRWTCKSTRNLADELNKQGHNLSHTRVAEQLRQMGYSLQGNKKTIEGTKHPDRNAQFEYINQKTSIFLQNGYPTISVDTKKKEKIGDFKNGGKELRPKGDPEKVRVHDFIIPKLGKVNPYGIYDQGKNIGWVNVGTDHDTAAFAVASIRRWWDSMGQCLYPNEKKLFITADGGGSNGYRVKLWKMELQNLADETGLEISVSHFPPGTSKWNKIEHRLFSHITQNWRGKPLISHETVVNLIAATTTRKGLRVECELDTNIYPKGIKISDKQLSELNLQRDEFHGEWNYTIRPRT